MTVERPCIAAVAAVVVLQVLAQECDKLGPHCAAAGVPAEFSSPSISCMPFEKRRTDSACDAAAVCRAAGAST
jgi:hypothetical protein